MTATRQETESLTELRDLLPPGSTAHTILRHVARSGMTRWISVVVDTPEGPRDVTWHVAQVTGFSLSSTHEGLRVGGCGMDMGFHVVYTLSSVLYREGFACLGADARCPANDHSNDYGAFSRGYDEEHAPTEKHLWWVSAQNSLYGLGIDLTEEERALRREYQEAKSAAWAAGAVERYSPSRIHSDGGYAVSQRWL